MYFPLNIIEHKGLPNIRKKFPGGYPYDPTKKLLYQRWEMKSASNKQLIQKNNDPFRRGPVRKDTSVKKNDPYVIGNFKISLNMSTKFSW